MALDQNTTENYDETISLDSQTFDQHISVQSLTSTATSNVATTTAIASNVMTTAMSSNDYTTYTNMVSNGITNINSSSTTTVNAEIGTKIKTADGAEYSSGNDDVFFVRVKKTVIPEQNASIVNILPVPALPGFDNNYQPSQRIGKMVKHPEFKKFRDRCNSFIDNHWPHQNPSPYDLATANMFYSGSLMDNSVCVSDQVTCYRCGGTLRNWNRTDDPVIEHAKIYPSCFKEKWIDGIYP